MSEDAFDRWYRTAKRIASVRAADVVRLRRLPAEDRLDLIQESLLELWRKRLAYDPRRGSRRTFEEHIVTNRLTSLMRRRNARCRRRTIEVDIDCIAGSLAAPDDGIELRTDVATVLAGVSVFDRKVASALSKYSAAETGIRLGVGRASIYRAIARLRIAFAGGGFDRRRSHKPCRRSSSEAHT